MKMNSSSTSDWVKFFVQAGIPSSVASGYAVIFADNRIKMNMLLDLNKEYLKEMGISVLGDIIAILKHAKELHAEMTKEKMLGPSMGLTKLDESQKNDSFEHLKRKGLESKRETPTKKAMVSPIHYSMYSNILAVDTIKPSSVFDRLGDSSVSSTTEVDNPSFTITGLGKQFTRTKNTPWNKEWSAKSSRKIINRMPLTSPFYIHHEDNIPQFTMASDEQLTQRSIKERLGSKVTQTVLSKVSLTPESIKKVIKKNGKTVIVVRKRKCKSDDHCKSILPDSAHIQEQLYEHKALKISNSPKNLQKQIIIRKSVIDHAKSNVFSRLGK